MKKASSPIRGLNIFIFFLITGLIYLFAVSCESGPPENSKFAQTQRGKAHYLNYCSDCHGENGKGLKIDSLEKQPADLTIIQARRREDAFPILEVARIIDGRKMAEAHGSRKMPVWGEVFSEDEHLDETQIKGKLGEIIAYLMSIQGG